MYFGPFHWDYISQYSFRHKLNGSVFLFQKEISLLTKPSCPPLLPAYPLFFSYPCDLTCKNSEIQTCARNYISSSSAVYHLFKAWHIIKEPIAYIFLSKPFPSKIAGVLHFASDVSGLHLNIISHPLKCNCVYNVSPYLCVFQFLLMSEGNLSSVL